MRSESHSNTLLRVALSPYQTPRPFLRAVIEGARVSVLVAQSAEDLSVIYSRRHEYNLLAPTTVIDTCMQRRERCGDRTAATLWLCFLIARALLSCTSRTCRLKVRPAGSKSSSKRAIHIILSQRGDRARTLSLSASSAAPWVCPSGWWMLFIKIFRITAMPGTVLRRITRHS